ncbi:hypothetical protein [Xylophilus rhododendri]|uniref:hypothetical protein n=1 Tax=Xylophilus rhododendri TaxID=2697032 RepID=UPI0018A26372|nr:hypothetical protein [Xylophilus rhododendri]
MSIPSSQPPTARGSGLSALRARFADFCAMAAFMSLESREESAAKVLAGLRCWSERMAAAQEAADRAPETDRVLAQRWGERLQSIVRDARAALARPADGGERPVSIAGHEATAIPLSRFPKPSPKPVARAARRGTSRPHGLRR